jgi:hypothetical protein
VKLKSFFILSSVILIMNGCSSKYKVKNTMTSKEVFDSLKSYCKKGILNYKIKQLDSRFNFVFDNSLNIIKKDDNYIGINFSFYFILFIFFFSFFSISFFDFCYFKNSINKIN